MASRCSDLVRLKPDTTYESVPSYVVSAFRRTVSATDVVSAFRRTVSAAGVVSAFRRTVSAADVVSAFRRTVSAADVVSAFRRTVSAADVVSALRRTISAAGVVALSLPLLAQQPSDRARTEALARRAGERLQALQREAERLASQESSLLNDLRKLEVERQIKSEELKRLDVDAAKVRAELAETNSRM